MGTETKNLTCIGCPMGCPITVVMADGQIASVTGNTCKVGDRYARQEVMNPTRIVTSTVAVTGGVRPLVSVKTREAIPKGRIFDCMTEINRARAAAPVAIGDVVISNVCGTGVDVVATSAVRRAE